MKRIAVGLLIVGALMGGTGGSALAAAGDNASEVGKCSSVLGRRQLRDDVARFLAHEARNFGLRNPGAFYSERAKVHNTTFIVCG